MTSANVISTGSPKNIFSSPSAPSSSSSSSSLSPCPSPSPGSLSSSAQKLNRQGRKRSQLCNLFNLHFVPFLLWLHVFLLVSFILLLLPKCESLRIIQVSVPRKSIVGDTVWLNCSYDLEQDTLYSIKWYKDSEEIYRFLPNNRPSHTVYETDGLFIDLSKSDFGNINTLLTSASSRGDFRCEVSAEAPSFQTARETKTMRVYRTQYEAASRTDWVHFSSVWTLILCTLRAISGNLNFLLK